MSGFRGIPESVTKTWGVREVTTSASPVEDDVIATAYRSTIDELTIRADFMRLEDVSNLPYLMTDSALKTEFEFAETVWEDLMNDFNSAIASYNRKILERSKELELSNASILGRSRTYSTQSQAPPMTQTVNNADQPTNHFYNVGRVETVNSGSVIHSATATNKKKPRPSGFTLWTAGRRRG